MGDSKSNDIVNSLHVYKFARAKSFLVWNVLIWLLSLATLLLVLYRDGPSWLAAFFVLSLVLFGAIAPISLRSIADLEVDRESISRRFLGRLLLKVPWKDVESIKVFEVYSRQQHRLRVGMHVRPRTKMSAFFPFMGQKIVIGDIPMSQGRFADLVAVLNAYIAEYHIRIESTVDGVTTHPDSLSYVPRRPDYDPIDWYNR